jgi:hypothetical protein
MRFTWQFPTALALIAIPLTGAAAEQRAMQATQSMRTMPDPIPWVDPTLVHIGAATSQGDDRRNTRPGALQSAAARDAFALDGSGITIGIISDSFNALGGQPATILTGDLPGPQNPFGFTDPVTILRDDLSSSSIDEGRAMAEIVHDLAPGARLLFHSAFNNGGGDASIAFAIDALRTAGADIIVDDVANLTQPFFQDGLSAAAADTAFAAGVAYFSSAGNAGDDAYTATFDGQLAGPNLLHNFDQNASEGGDEVFDVTLPPGAFVRVVLQWDDRYPSLAPVTGPPNDLDLAVLDAGGRIVDISQRDQTIGADPWELVAVTNPAATDASFGLVVVGFQVLADAPEFKITLFGPFTNGDDDATFSPTNFGQSAAAGAQAVAAVFYNSTTVESFSSRGPTRIVFDRDGDRIDAVRAKPDITATNGVDTTFFGTDIDGTGNPNFFGTSAAAPHAAAVAALLLQRAADLGVTLDPAALYDLLAATAVDLAAPGFDNVAGAGLIDALAAATAVVDLAPLLGDLNCDGAVDFLDIDPFVTALVNPAAFAAAQPDCPRTQADINTDGAVNFFDIDPFVALLVE